MLLVTQHTKCVTEIAETKFNRAEAILAKVKEASRVISPKGREVPPKRRENPYPNSQFLSLNMSYTPGAVRESLSKYIEILFPERHSQYLRSTQSNTAGVTESTSKWLENFSPERYSQFLRLIQSDTQVERRESLLK